MTMRRETNDDDYLRETNLYQMRVRKEVTITTKNFYFGNYMEKKRQTHTQKWQRLRGIEPVLAGKRRKGIPPPRRLSVIGASGVVSANAGVGVREYRDEEVPV